MGFHLNFDDTQKEPDLLPARFPNLLVNGASGIAVGLATNIPPHNLGEAIDAAAALIDRPSIDTRGLMQFLKGPDFPTGGILAADGEASSGLRNRPGQIAGACQAPSGGRQRRPQAYRHYRNSLSGEQSRHAGENPQGFRGERRLCFPAFMIFATNPTARACGPLSRCARTPTRRSC